MPIPLISHRQRLSHFVRAPRGFTLVELVVVLTIIAILASVSFPRLIEAQKDARVAKAKTLYGTLRSASAMAKGRCELDLAANNGQGCTADAGVVNLEGSLVTMVFRYPTANLAGILTAAAIKPAADGLNLLNAGGSGASASLVVSVDGATTPAACRVTYIASPTSGVAPTIDLDTTGC